MNRRKNVLGAAIAFGVLVPVMLSGCGAAGGLGGMAGAVPGVGGKCPDLSKPESILAFDFAGNFKISAQAGAKLKASTAAAVELKGFADQVDADLKAGCGAIAKDLGAGADFKDGKSACEAAIKGITDTKAKIGGGLKLSLNVKPPRCQADLNAYGDCAGKCDASVTGGKAKVECEPGKLSGKCDASCEGSCDVQAGAKCDGSCTGSCDAEVKASCSGKCNGKCDGKDSKGASCAGTCEGKCEGGTINGECKGKCGGECKLKASAKCEGTCTGKCSAEFKEPKCTGEVIPPKISADCKAHCDASVSAKAECTPAQVGVVASGGTDLKALETLKATLEKNLPLVLKVAVGMGEKSIKMAGNAKTVIEGTMSSMTEIAGSGGGQAALTVGQLTACLGDTFKGAISAAGSLQANVSVSVNVSASASGSAGGGAKGGTGGSLSSQ
ncbi:MAG: Flagellar hook-length control protein FliK [Labilithrix sp.]|nr:Flagellar hook-length control protein FliK [Labilithrix sp.]